jgi:hypothetical protein
MPVFFLRIQRMVDAAQRINSTAMRELLWIDLR